MGNNNIADNIDPQLINIENDETNNRLSGNVNLGINLNITSTISGLSFCTGCKRNCTSNLFSGHIPGKIYKLCSACRLRKYNRRRSNAQDQSNVENISNISGTEYCFVNNNATKTLI